MLKMTKQRTLLLDYLKKSTKPLSAEMVYLKLPQGSMNLSTIYRSLEAFEVAGLVDKTNLGNLAYYKIRSHEHKHYLVCKNCHKMIEIDCHVDSFLEIETKKHHFKVESHDLTVYGYCEKCQTLA
jgi:Fe2+ or Zn2+ uptake regulation protein